MVERAKRDSTFERRTTPASRVSPTAIRVLTLTRVRAPAVKSLTTPTPQPCATHAPWLTVPHVPGLPAAPPATLGITTTLPATPARHAALVVASVPAHQHVPPTVATTATSMCQPHRLALSVTSTVLRVHLHQFAQPMLVRLGTHCLEMFALCVALTVTRVTRPALASATRAAARLASTTSV